MAKQNNAITDIKKLFDYKIISPDMRIDSKPLESVLYTGDPMFLKHETELKALRETYIEPSRK